MELTEGTVLTIILGVIVLAVATIAMTVNAVFNALNARGDAILSGVLNGMNEIAVKLTSRMDALEVRMDAHEAVIGQRLASIEAAVAAGAEEHRRWQIAMKEINERLDAQGERIDKLLMHLLNQKG